LVPLEADYFRKNWFIYALVWFLLAVVSAGMMFITGRTLAGRISHWATGKTAYVKLPVPLGRYRGTDGRSIRGGQRRGGGGGSFRPGGR
jgi:hypothetical protein